jgi:hypothetical protein
MTFDDNAFEAGTGLIQRGVRDRQNLLRHETEEFLRALSEEYEVLVEDGSGVWKRVPEMPEHPFVGFGATLDNGESWALPAGTKAHRVKLHLVSGYGPTLRLSEIRIYGRRG